MCESRERNILLKDTIIISATLASIDPHAYACHGDAVNNYILNVLFIVECFANEQDEQIICQVAIWHASILYQYRFL